MAGTVDPASLPVDGWRCLKISDLGTAVGDCDRCGKEKIRFVHHIVHPQYPSILAVGCVCAGEMLGDPEGVRRRERRMKTKPQRKQRWMRRKWEPCGRWGVGTFWRGRELLVFQAVGGDEHGRWMFTIEGELREGTYETAADAKAAIFDVLWEMPLYG